MMRFQSIPLLALATFSLLPGLSSAKYILKDDLSYKNFFNKFELFTGPDPTNGFVQYLDLPSAISSQLVGYYNESVFLGVDFKVKDPQGRASVRVESTTSYNHGVMVMDIGHMPDSTCGTWPAAWLLSASTPWPQGGEIDILEGVNDYMHNAVTLHTSAGCVVDNSTNGGQGEDSQQMAFEGFMTTDDCDVNASGQGKNVGCSIKAPRPEEGVDECVATYGTDFNAKGGGVYTMEWTRDGISVWFFPRDALESTAKATIPDLTTNPDPSTWGTPLARFSGAGCDFSKRFRDLKIIFDTTFCGEWAGKEWSESCAEKTGVSTCEEYVRENPEVFESAYWEIRGLRWFEEEGK
ncbi:glycoside hydrolase family 16 protein [Amniculicola lignicola CBS 123094]|uniref:endo-1,3(4)-beta-glucanase n=1 Tax=Amniculicola lignicola CBS 123094 TaxID=1392246 RepID=A0A6A5WH81_9PLEO|nr:glycoside hydrolase family 16 protein [Amniculicola lignicola CBS 123094]